MDRKILSDALTEVKNKYGKEIAINVERIYRMETAHFRSNGFKNTFSPGMEKHSDIYPWGWVSMQTIWGALDMRPVGFWKAKEGKGLSNNGGKVKTFLRFATVQAAMFSLSEYLLKYRPGRWYSTQLKMQEKYEAALLTIVPRIVNSLP